MNAATAGETFETIHRSSVRTGLSRARLIRAMRDGSVRFIVLGKWTALRVADVDALASADSRRPSAARRSSRRAAAHA